MKKIGFGLMVLSLGACTEFSTNGDHMYAKSQNAPKLMVPEPLCASNISDYYDLPPQEEDPRVSVIPPKEPIDEES